MYSRAALILAHQGGLACTCHTSLSCPVLVVAAGDLPSLEGREDAAEQLEGGGQEPLDRRRVPGSDWACPDLGPEVEDEES